MQRIIIIIWAILLSGQVLAQEQLTQKQQADRLFERYEYFKSLNLYLRVLRTDKPDVHITERIAECYRMMDQYQNAEKWYARTVATPGAHLLSFYHYAEILLNNQKFELAKEQFKRYFMQAADHKALALKLACCDSAALWTKQSPPYIVENAEQLNSIYSDWGLSYFGEKDLIFTSDRKTGDEGKEKNIYNRTGNGWLKLYLASRREQVIDKFTGTESSIFNNDYHIGPIALNATADTAYITVTTAAPGNKLMIDKPNGQTEQRLYTRRLELISVIKKNGQWASHVPFPYNNINKYSVGHAALSKDGNLIYFTSDMPGGQGKTDIWYCQKLIDGTWGLPVNCGNTINTEEEEAFPTIAGTGELYFSSKGLPGMGGYDIFSATGKTTSWTKPVNLKYPVNTTTDDFWLTTEDGLTGYLSSNREGGKGSDDIYIFKPSRLISSEAPKPDTSRLFEPGKTFILKDIYYDLDKSDIRADAAVELDKLVVILQQNPGLKIELSSHTDSRASDTYNLALSNRRAISAVNYLIMKGISKDRLVAKGYGELHLLNKCSNGAECSEQEHQLNRRTEVRIIDNKF